MDNKGSAVVILAVTVVVLAGTIVCLLFKQTHVSANTQPDAAAPVSVAPPSIRGSKGVIPSKHKRAALDQSSAFAREYKTLLIKALREPANFNEHYVVTDIGCGSACFYYAVIDKDTGKAYKAPIANDLGELSGGESSGDMGPSYSLHSNLIEIITENGSKINTYAFTAAGFSLVSSRPAR